MIAKPDEPPEVGSTTKNPKIYDRLIPSGIVSGQVKESFLLMELNSFAKNGVKMKITTELSGQFALACQGLCSHASGSRSLSSGERFTAWEDCGTKVGSDRGRFR